MNVVETSTAAAGRMPTLAEATRSPRFWIMVASIFCVAFAYGGAMVAKALPTGVFTPIILVALLVVLLFTIFKPQMGAGGGQTDRACGSQKQRCTQRFFQHFDAVADGGRGFEQALGGAGNS